MTPPSSDTPHFPEFIRQEQNGKIVYVPNPKTDRKTELRSQPQVPLEKFRPKTRGFLRFLAAWIWPLTSTTAGLISFSLVWLGWQSLTNPDMTYWINQFTPGNLNRKIPAQDQPKTVEQVQNQLERNGKRLGDPIVLASDFSFLTDVNRAQAFAIPSLGSPQASCSQSCQLIQEIHVYRALNLPRLIKLFQGENQYRRTQRIQILGPSELDINQITKWVIKSGRTDGNSTPLGLTNISATQQGNKDEHWLILSGSTPKGNASVSYGQILYYSPDKSRLNVMFNWISLGGFSPQWQDLSGDEQPEIIIDQSLGLEPSYVAYEVSQAPSGAKWVRPIEFKNSAIADSQYRLAMKLADHRLWLAADDLLSKIQPRLSDQWSAQAQGQAKLIQIHADFFRKNSDLGFADPVEEIQSLLVRGQWSEALKRYQRSPSIHESMQRVLASDQGQIGDRINFAAKVGPEKKSALDWAILYQQVKGGKAQAKKWLKDNHPNQLTQIQDLDKFLNSSKKKPN